MRSGWYLHKYSGDYEETNSSWVRTHLFEVEPDYNRVRRLGLIGAI
jgi:hypothetical protein